ncbi:thioredoxin domain-containing protein [Pleurocapsa sp. PCC 7319]|uniref:thioredoxin domain-containing protein n=1 Tax=Pleurocapsa sp. PCC 7319 TaxID=118161 RepID=UPI0003452682|nr:thioredoxin domain-containing protein [Pleurocapsa sp. PCC 7319]
MNFSITEVNTDNFTNEVIDKSTDKPVLVFFHATWCHFCQDLSPRLEKLSSDYDLILAKVDVDQNPELVQKYGVQTFPDVQLINNGEVTDGFLGALSDPLIMDFFFRNQLQPHDLLLGGDGHEIMFGGPGNDKLDGGPGNDKLFGRKGNDQLYGNSGKDSLLGGSGDDYLWGGNGNDLLAGGSGDDYLWGGNGNDLLAGGGGDDNLWGGNGNDFLRGGAGNDNLWGGNGNDFLRGGPGNELMAGDSGNDTLIGGTGSDILVGVDTSKNAGKGEIDILTGSAGRNTFVLGTSNQVFYDDGELSSIGTKDYAKITDFKIDKDIILLAQGFNYRLGSSPIANLTGTGIFVDNQSGVDELIGVVRDIELQSLDLNNSSQFIFV